MNWQNLMELCMRPAPLGREETVKEWIRGKLPDHVEITEDPAGSLIVRRPGEKPGLAFLASLTQPTLLATGKTAEGAWRLQPLGMGTPPAAENGWRLTDGRGAAATLSVKEGVLQLTDETGIQAGTLLTRAPDWSQDEQAVRCSGLADRIGCWLLLELLQELPDTKAEITCLFLAQEAHNPRTAELAANEIDPAVVLRIGAAPVNNTGLTGAPVAAEKGPALKLRERYASADGRLMDLLKSMCREGNIPYQYELLEMTVTGLYTAQYGRCGVVIGGMDVPEENGRILLSDLCSTRALVLAAAQNADRMLEELASRPAVRHIQ